MTHWLGGGGSVVEYTVSCVAVCTVYKCVSNEMDRSPNLTILYTLCLFFMASLIMNTT
jgi:hypothetical protein